MFLKGTLMTVNVFYITNNIRWALLNIYYNVWNLNNAKLFIILQYETDYQKVISATEQIPEQQPVYTESMCSAEKICDIKKLLF